MNKNIVICCDGTGNRFAEDNTNVVKLFGVLDLDDESRQVAYYHSGLGTNPAAAALTRLSQAWTRLLGLAFGYGIAADLRDCYEFLMNNYEEGDRVFLFGFSRGAFMVRALAGMLHMVGLLRKGNNHLVPFAVDLLKRSAPTAFPLAARFKATFPRECKPYFIGVWDTVSSVGWIYDPLRIPYTFRNPDLSIGRHAVSIDERRAFFRQNLWAAAGPGQDIKQAWFAGVHSDVGGGYPESESGLAKISLEWMIQEAVAAGLLVKHANVDKILGHTSDGEFVQPDAQAVQHESLRESWLFAELLPHRYIEFQSGRARYRWRLSLGRPRRIPQDALIHQSVVERRKVMNSYRPPNLPEQSMQEPWVRWRSQGARPASGPEPAAGLATADVALRDVPTGLVEQLKSGACILYAGAGVSATAGLPVWEVCAAQLIDVAERNGLINTADAQSYREALRDHKTDYVVDAIVRSAPPEFLLPFLRATFQGMRQVPQSYRDLAEMPFSAFMTTNLDSLLERAVNPETGSGGPPRVPVLTPKDTDALVAALTRSERFLLYLYGTLDRPDSLMISPGQFDEAMSNNLGFREFVANLFGSRTLLFVGASLDGIETYLRGLRMGGRTSRTHYALCGVSGQSWQVIANGLRDRYGIEVIPYHGGSAKELERLVASLKAAVGPAWQPRTEAFPLKSVILKNIGPFEDLRLAPNADTGEGGLALHADTNIFLGNNGVGKSTILRAIAVAVSGKQASPFAGRLLRKHIDAATGSVEIEGGWGSYTTQIQVRTAGPAEVTSPTVVPMVAEQWLVLGFPPLRTYSGGRSEAGADGVLVPTPQDAIPLARNEPDSRLNNLQRWVVKLDHQAKDEITKGVKDGPNQRLIAKFFSVLDRLTEGVKLRFHSVDPAAEQIFVETDDGVMPLDYVSQGTASLISWVGVVLQRLYEVYGTDEDPTQRYFLVLMDEIDAHMHPEWQRIVLGRVRAIFPKMQLLATTHSPLIIADLPAEKIFHVLRGEGGKVIVRKHEVAPAELSANQILTSPLFGLGYARGVGFEEDEKKFEQMRKDKHADPAKVEALAQKLYGRKPVEIESLEGKTYDALLSNLADSASGASAEKSAELLDHAERILKRKLAEL
jgi:uncharacterized protein (DUF2235 family)